MTTTDDPKAALRALAEKTSEVVPLAQAEKILDDVLRDLETAEQEAASYLSDTHHLEERLERLQDRETPLETFEKVIQAAHERARHVGRWDVCPHPICREVEDQLLAVRKGLA